MRAKRGAAKPQQGDDPWTVVYANMMTILLIFFLVMWALKVSDRAGRKYEKVIAGIQKAFGGKPDKSKMEAAEQRDKERKVAAELSAIGAGIAEVEVTNDMIKVVLPTPILFDSGSAEIKSLADSVLSEFGRKLAELPENEIIVAGHTDNIPLGPSARYGTNWELSGYRALNMVHRLIKYGVPSNKITPIGYGEFKPLFGNDTPENRAQNRRLEISILRRPPS